jgi:hypothetical protein
MVDNSSPTIETETNKCGIVMPISGLDGLSESHWADVLRILTEAISDAGFEPTLVSSTDEIGIIQKTIIENLYDNPIVVCDVSGKNPNVMFELGMRLAFDKPTVIVKDDKTAYSFDTSPIQHLTYPRDLRFTQIVEFKGKLSSKIRQTYKKASEDNNFSTFLKHFGEFKVAKIEKTEVSGQQFIIDELQSLKASIARLDRSSRSSSPSPIPVFCIASTDRKNDNLLRDYIKTLGDDGVISEALDDVKIYFSHIIDSNQYDKLKDLMTSRASRRNEQPSRKDTSGS